MKTRHKQRKAYHKNKSPSSDIGLNRYKQTRTSDRKELEVGQAYYTNRIYQPLKKGISKPFYKFLEADKNKRSNGISLTDEYEALTNDPEHYAELVNSFFKSQF